MDASISGGHCCMTGWTNWANVGAFNVVFICFEPDFPCTFSLERVNISALIMDYAILELTGVPLRLFSCPGFSNEICIDHSMLCGEGSRDDVNRWKTSRSQSMTSRKRPRRIAPSS